MSGNLEEALPIKLDTLSGHEIHLVGRFQYLVDGDTALSRVLEEQRPWSVAIDLSRFLKIGDTTIPVESICALEWRPCNIELATPKQRRESEARSTTEPMR